MAEGLKATAALHWCAAGPFEGDPRDVLGFLAGDEPVEDFEFSLGESGGWEASFRYLGQEISLKPGQWLLRLADSSLLVDDEAPAGFEG